MNYRICLGLFPRLKREASSAAGVEAFLDSLATESETDPVIRQQLMALRFYLARIIREFALNWEYTTVHGTTNYAELLDRIDKWRRRANEAVTLVTFNYDPLLENAAENVLPHFPRGFRTMEDYTSGKAYKILKVHGSTTWFRLLMGAQFGDTIPNREAEEYAIAVRNANFRPPQLGTFYTEAQQNEITLSRGHDKVLVPAIAIPVQQKAAFECPPDHVEALGAAIRSTTKLLVIGWKGMEHNFMKMWQPTDSDGPAWNGPPNLTSVLVVDVDDFGKVTEKEFRVTGHMTNTPIEHFTDGFSNFLRTNKLDMFLER